MARQLGVLLILIALATCGKPEQPKQLRQAEFHEAIELVGVCKEDHVINGATYKAILLQHKNLKDSRITTSGMAILSRGTVGEELRRFKESRGKYRPPDSISFVDVALSESDSSVTLHGVSSKTCDERPGDENLPESPDCLGSGFPTTCGMRVIGRSKQELDLKKWVLAASRFKSEAPRSAAR